MSRPLLSRPLVRALLPLACTPLLAAQGLVDTARRYVQTPEGSFHYLADLDGDGDDDVVWFHDDPGPDSKVLGFRAFFNDGRGELGQPGPLTAFPDTDFRSLNTVGLRRLADVTNDGLADFVVGSTPPALDATSTLHVYPAIAPGVFGAPISIPLGGAIAGAALGNVDADAAREIAIVEYVPVSVFQRDEVTAWYDWNGSGFTRSPGPVTPGSLEKRPTMLAALDLEGDGDSDLVYGRTNARALRMMLTTGGSPGPATFVSLPLGEAGWLGPYTCDLAGGGPEDLLVVSTGNADIALVPVLNEGGVLVAQEERILPVGWSASSASSFRTADWDADGDADVLYFGWRKTVGSSEGVLAFFANDGANAFGTEPVALAETNDPPVGESPGSPVDPCDLDGDGRLDVVLPHSVQLGRGSFESTLVEITATFFGAFPVGLFDHEGDGDLDLLSSSAVVALNDGAGGFDRRILPPPPPPMRTLGGIAGIGDFGGDGRTDFLAGILIPPATSFDDFEFDEIRLYEDDGLGGFRDAGRASGEDMLFSDRRTNLAHDLDGDADVDVLGRRAGGGGYWPNGGRGRFGAFVPLFGCCSIPSALGDLDADGNVDVVTCSFSPSAVDAWLDRAPDGRVRRVGEHAPRFDPTRVFQASQGSVASQSVTLADHDRDGDLDLAFSMGVQVRLLVNDGAAAFSPGAVLSTELASGIAGQVTYMAFEDLDDDGNVDLLGGGHQPGYPRSVVVFRSLGDGSFETARAHTGSIMAEAGDLDGDGDLDLSGNAIVRSLRFDGPRDGRIRQYGAGTPGSGGSVPVLGAMGPLRIGSPEAKMLLRRGRGGAPFALFHSLGAGTGPAVPYPGAPTLLGPPIHSDLYMALGAPGQAGAGRFDLDLGPELASLAGLTLYFQAGLVDPEGADGFAFSNGLELTFGF
jgi:hypothetical protein